MSTLAVRDNHSGRGKWLESAVLATGMVYQRRAIGIVVQQPVGWRQIVRNGITTPIRVKASVDFIGAYGGIPIAFDAKATKLALLRTENVAEHQLDMLASFTSCTGVGFLLVAFERPDLGRTFACTAKWFHDTLIRLAHRQSIPFASFEAAADRGSNQCCEVFHGAEGVPVNFGPAARKLQLAINAKT